MATISIPIAELRTRKLFVATPMYGGQCFGTYTKSCIDLNAICMRHGIAVEFHFIFNESLITRARNYLVDEFLRSDCTHMVFIDSDIDFNPMDVLAMLAINKDIIGGPYPKKTIAWEKIYDAVKLGLIADGNPNQLELYSGDYVFNPVPGVDEISLDEPVEVLEIGTGFMMVNRTVFERFAAAYPDFSYLPDHNRSASFDGSREIHMFFQALIDPASKRYLSEDYMFCQYCRRLGITIFFCPWMRLKHAGTYIYGGTMQALGELSHKQREHKHNTPVSTVAPDKVVRV